MNPMDTLAPLGWHTLFTAWRLSPIWDLVVIIWARDRIPARRPPRPRIGPSAGLWCSSAGSASS